MKSTLAFAVSVAAAGTAHDAGAQQGGANSGALEEITVTARKREESMQEIPASIQAFSGAQLQRRGLLNMEDVVRFLPNVNHIGGVAGSNKIIFRGVSDNPNAFIAASSAAVYIDEQPLTQFSVNPEPRLVDMQRVEALAGPQGTLYGDSAQSGTIRFITNKPDPTEFAANVDLMLRTGSDSSESYDVSGTLNLPLVEDKFAIRLVGFTAQDGGFIDNVLGASPMLGGKDNANLVQDDINEVSYLGGRVAAKWFVNDEWAVTGSLISQKMEAEGLNDYDPTVGDLKTVKFFKDTRDDEWWQAALTIDGNFGNWEFLSVTSYFDRQLDYQFDRTNYSAYFNYNFCPFYATYCWSGQTLYDQDTTGFNTQNQSNDRITQEFRLTYNGEKSRLILGAFYEEKNESWNYDAYTPEFLDSLSYYYWTNCCYYTASGGAPAWWRSNDSTKWEQWAMFANLNYDFNEQWSAEIGLRYFDQEMDRTYFVDKPFIDSPSFPDFTNPKGSQDDFVPKISVTYRLDEEKLIYALYSEGWRAGGANRNRVAEELTFFPLVYEPDKLENFEIGAKTRWLDNRLQINATAFFGQWKNYQIEALDPSFQPCIPPQDPSTDPCGQPFQVVVANVGDAEQTGLEFDLRALPSDNLELGFGFAWINAETSEDFLVNQVVSKGTRLPNVPEWKFNGFAEYTWQTGMLGGGDLYLRGQYTWQDDSRNQLEDYEAENRVSARGTFIQPSYGIGDIKLGMRGSNWTLEGFVNNVGDERAVLYNDDLFFDPYWDRRRVTTNRPREFGVRFTYSVN